jgi:hypothetical protein
MSDRYIRVENLRRLDVRPGDRFVMMVPHAISSEQAEHIQAYWRDFIGNEPVKLLILTLGVIRQEDAAG